MFKGLFTVFLSGAFTGAGLALIRLLFLKLTRKKTGGTKNEDEILQKAAEIREQNNVSPEEGFLILADELHSAQDLLKAWKQFELAEKYPKADELIARQAESEKKNGKADDLKIYNIKKILRSMMVGR